MGASGKLERIAGLIHFLLGKPGAFALCVFLRTPLDNACVQVEQRSLKRLKTLRTVFRARFLLRQFITVQRKLGIHARQLLACSLLCLSEVAEFAFAAAEFTAGLVVLTLGEMHGVVCRLDRTA